jgi:hypothetical protein
VKNIDTIESILQVIHKDNMNFMAPDDSYLYDSDSDDSTCSTTSELSNSEESWQVIEREERIKDSVDEAIAVLNEEYSSQYVSTDWENNAFKDVD